MVRTRARPQRHFVELASKVHKCDRETCFTAAATIDFDWEDGRVRLGVIVVVWVGAVAEGAGDDTHAGFVCCDDKQQFQWNRL